MRIIGIDPGVNGACALITESGKFLDCFDMPTVLANKSSNRQMVNAAELAKLLRAWLVDAPEGIVAVIENVQPMPSQALTNGARVSMPSASAFAMGKSVGSAEGVIATLGIGLEKVTAQTWKRWFQLSREKDASRELAQRMFPDAPLGRKKDHNRAEAILIARYYQQRMMAPSVPRGASASDITVPTAGAPF